MSKIAKTVCARDCYDSCSMEFEIDEGKIVNVRGDKSHPITRGFLCPRGNREVKRILTNRIERPHIRINGHLQPVDWNTALDKVVQRLRYVLDHRGPEAVLYLTYDGNAGLIHNQFVHRLWHRIDATLTDMAICTTTGHTILKMHFGESHGVKPIELPEQKMIVFWGFNAAVSGPHIWAKAVEARKKGAKIITIEPLKTVTALNSDTWIRPKPGTDAALALFLINQFFQRNAVDWQFLEKYTIGANELKESVKVWTLEKTAEFTGVSPEVLLKLADDYIKFRPSATMIGVALQKKNFGWEHIRAIAFVPTVLGLHRSFFYSNGQSYYIDYNYITGATFHKTSNIVSQVAIGEYVAQGRFDFIFVSSMNPAQTLTGAQKFVSGKEKNNVFLTVVDTHWSRTAKMADVVLPAPTFAEKPDVLISWGHHFTQYSEAVIAPMFESKSEVWIMQQLARRLGLKDWWLYEKTEEALAKAMANSFEDGRGFLLSPETRALRTKPKDYYPTGSGKIEFYSKKALDLGINPLPQQPPLPHLQGENEFFLLSSAVSQYTNSQFWEVFGQPEPQLLINPKDARILQIADGQVVNVRNEFSQVRLYAKISDFVPQRVVWFARSIDDLDGKPVNGLIPTDYQKVGHGPFYHLNVVTVEKVI